MDKQTLVNKVYNMSVRLQNYEFERQARHSFDRKSPPTYTYPARWELEQLLSEISNFLGYEGLPVITSVTVDNGKIVGYSKSGPNPYIYSKEQHITDLQTRNGELVEKNRQLERKLNQIRDLTS